MKTQNKLIVMSKAEIDKHREVAKSNAFWGKWYEQMAEKPFTLQLRKRSQKTRPRLTAHIVLLSFLTRNRQTRKPRKHPTLIQETGEVIDLSVQKAAIPQSTNVDMPVHIESPAKAEKVPIGTAATEEMMRMEF